MTEMEIGMTKEEMRRYLEQQADQGDSELEAYRNLMKILGVEVPHTFDTEE